MDLLVVGASGFLGRNVLESAGTAGRTVTATYWTDTTLPDFASGLGCDVVRYDLLGPSRSWDQDVCIYLAGNADHRWSVESPIDDLRLNAEGLNRFLAGFAGGLVFMSSAAVYDGREGRVSPAVPPNPTLPYAISKLAAERYLWHRVARGRLPWATVVRLYYAYGRYDRGNRLVPRLVKAVLDGDGTFGVTAPSGSLLDPLWAGDVAGALLAATTGRAKGQTLDLCGGNPSTIPALVRVALDIWGSKMSIVEHTRPDETPVRFHSSPQRVRRSLSLETFVPFKTGVRRYLDWIRASVA